jgi:general secretion pathway protein E
MVGEIRDLETAEIAVQASLTGHLVLSTLHTNTAVGAVTRLRDMGVEPFLLSSSIAGVLAQRLIRRLCPHCKVPDEATAQEREALGATEDEGSLTLYRPVGCEQCNDMGYRGRSGLFELLPVDAKVRQMIHDGDGEQAIESHALGYSMSLRDDGLRRVRAGETTLEEVLRVSTNES